MLCCKKTDVSSRLHRDYGDSDPQATPFLYPSTFPRLDSGSAGRELDEVAEPILAYKRTRGVGYLELSAC